MSLLVPDKLSGNPGGSKPTASREVLAFLLPARYCSRVPATRRAMFRAGVILRRHPFERGTGPGGHARMPVARIVGLNVS
jgi:hypothetical protein